MKRGVTKALAGARDSCLERPSATVWKEVQQADQVCFAQARSRHRPSNHSSGAAPEGVWMEAEGELQRTVHVLQPEIEVDGYMVAAVIYFCSTTTCSKTATLLAAGEIMSQLGQRRSARPVDRAILFGTGTNMPVGIVTRLAQDLRSLQLGHLCARLDGPTHHQCEEAEHRRHNRRCVLRFTGCRPGRCEAGLHRW